MKLTVVSALCAAALLLGACADNHPARTAAAPSQLVATVQNDLVALGYNPGQVDGRDGPSTDAAVRGYQQANGLVIDGAITPALADKLAQHRRQVGR